MASAISRLWADRLEDGRIDNFNKVPAKLQDSVRELIYADGYVINADGTITKT